VPQAGRQHANRHGAARQPQRRAIRFADRRTARHREAVATLDGCRRAVARARHHTAAEPDVRLESAVPAEEIVDRAGDGELAPRPVAEVGGRRRRDTGQRARREERRERRFKRAAARLDSRRELVAER